MTVAYRKDILFYALTNTYRTLNPCLCFHRKTLQCWWSSAFFNGWEAQLPEWGVRAAGEGESHGQTHFNPCVLHVYLLHMEAKVVFRFRPLLRIVWWPKGRIGWGCRQTWSSSRVIGAAWTHLRPTWRTRRPSWIMSWRTAVNATDLISSIFCFCLN